MSKQLKILLDHLRFELEQAEYVLETESETRLEKKYAQGYCQALRDTIQVIETKELF